MPLANDATKWSVDEVGVWLSQIGMGHLADTFAEEAIDGEVLLELKMDELKDLGLKLGDRKKLMTRLGPLTSAMGAVTSSASTERKSNKGGVTFQVTDPNASDETNNSSDPPVMLSGVSIKNTFIDVAEEDADSGERYKPYHSDPTGRFRFKGINQPYVKRPAPVLESTQEMENEEADLVVASERAPGNVQYVTPSFQGADGEWEKIATDSTRDAPVSFAPLSSATRRGQRGAQKSTGSRSGVSSKVSIKNTFLHVEEPETPSSRINVPSKPYAPSVSDPLGRFYVRGDSSDEDDPGFVDLPATLGHYPIGWPDPGPAPVPLAAVSSLWGANALPPFSWAPQAGACPPVGAFHTFHHETRGFGTLAADARSFTKGPQFEGRLSVVTESEIHAGGTHRYLVRYAQGVLTKPDGVGFVFSDRLPCPKNIQKITSIFANQQGQICMRIFGGVLKGSGSCKLRPFGLGEWIEVAVDLDNLTASFHIWPCGPMNLPFLQGGPECSAYFQFGKKLFNRSVKVGQTLPQLNVGHFACVVQNSGVTVTLGS
jgi:hypothetical protein